MSRNNYYAREYRQTGSYGNGYGYSNYAGANNGINNGMYNGGYYGANRSGAAYNYGGYAGARGQARMQYNDYVVNPYGAYTYGSAARELEDDDDDFEELQPQAQPKKKKLTRAEKRRLARIERSRRSAQYNREKVGHMNPALVTFLVAVMACISVFLVKYIGLQYEVTSMTREVAVLEKELTAQKMRNDELLSSVNGSINLDEIKYKAITELGMTYAAEGQIIAYENEIDDYVHQVAEVDN